MVAEFIVTFVVYVQDKENNYSNFHFIIILETENFAIVQVHFKISQDKEVNKMFSKIRHII